MAVSYLYGAFGKELINRRLPFLESLNESKLNIIVEMIEKDVNSPKTSSLGRLFDGIAAMVGIRSHVAFEGHALSCPAWRAMASGFVVSWAGVK